MINNKVVPVSFWINFLYLWGNFLACYMLFSGTFPDKSVILSYITELMSDCNKFNQENKKISKWLTEMPTLCCW